MNYGNFNIYNKNFCFIFEICLNFLKGKSKY